MGPSGTVATGPSAKVTLALPSGATDSTTVRSPPQTTTCWGTRSAGIRPERWTPKARAEPLLRTEKNPGIEASASSFMASKIGRPTLRSSLSLTVRHHWATASSLDAGSSLSVRTTRDSTASKSDRS